VLFAVVYPGMAITANVYIYLILFFQPDLPVNGEKYREFRISKKDSKIKGTKKEA
jgi:hypothetical protein